jgi:hypothetical protein
VLLSRDRFATKTPRAPRCTRISPCYLGVLVTWWHFLLPTHCYPTTPIWRHYQLSHPFDVFRARDYTAAVLPGDHFKTHYEMRATRFCSACGEPVNSRQTSLPLRSFCRRCSPKFNRARLILLATIPVCIAIGYAAGRFTSLHKPFVLIGTPVDQPAGAPSSNPASSTIRRETERHPGESIPSAQICGARTKSGKPCQRKVKGGGHCWQHRATNPEKADPHSAP